MQEQPTGISIILSYRLFTDAEDVVRQFGWYVETDDENLAFAKTRGALLDQLDREAGTVGVQDFVWLSEERI